MPKLTSYGYLPLQKFHILPVYGIFPADIKKSAKSVFRDRETKDEFGHSSLLNACAKSLGFSGGFSGYKKEVSEKLIPFMKKHNLVELSNLVSLQFKGDYCLLSYQLKRQDISERLFYSGKPLPKKLFTGYNFRYDLHFDDGFYQFPYLIGSYDDYSFSNVRALKNYINEAKKYPNVLLRFKSSKRALIDVVIGSQSIYLPNLALNLINDFLVLPKLQGEYDPQLYYTNDNKKTKEEVLPVCREFADLFAERIKELDRGWVKIIPYNENLIFLQGDNGEYDFVFRNQRDSLFKHNIYEPYLKRSDIPLFDETYHFQRWYYFKFEGFRLKIEHLAEKSFYENGGALINYNNTLYEYLYNEYSKTLKNRKTLKKLEGFNLIKLESGNSIMVSNLVSIADFNLFLNDNKDYLKSRHEYLDELDTINSDEDDSLPISLTYYDVLQYINWFNKKNNVQARLVSYKEYQEISPFELVDLQSKDWWSEDDLLFFDEKDRLLNREEYHRYSTDFQLWKLKFNKPKFELKNGLRFMHNGRFAEWLLEKTCIRSFSLTSFYGDKAVLRTDSGLLSCTGKHKYIKIGFRLCYDLIDNER